MIANECLIKATKWIKFSIEIDETWLIRQSIHLWEVLFVGIEKTMSDSSDHDDCYTLDGIFVVAAQWVRTESRLIIW